MARTNEDNARMLRYLALLAENPSKSKYQAVIEAGYVGRPGMVVAALERTEFMREVSEAAEEQGITLQSCLAKLSDLMEAKEKKAFVTRYGGVVYAEETGLADIQLKATQTAMDLLGLSSKARIAAAEEKRPVSDGVNILVLAQRFEHLSDEQLEEAMQLMRVGQFEGSALAGKAGAVEIGGVTVNGNGEKA